MNKTPTKKKERVSDAELQKLLEQLKSLVDEHGPRGACVREFIQQNKHKGDFKDLAVTFLALRETASE